MWVEHWVWKLMGLFYKWRSSDRSKQIKDSLHFCPNMIGYCNIKVIKISNKISDSQCFDKLLSGYNSIPRQGYGLVPRGLQAMFNLVQQNIHFYKRFWRAQSVINWALSTIRRRAWQYHQVAWRSTEQHEQANWNVTKESFISTYSATSTLPWVSSLQN